MKTRIWGLLLVVVLLSPLWIKADSHVEPRKLSLNEARDLAHMALGEQARKLPGLDFDNYKNQNFPDFYFFSVIWGSSDSGGGGTVEQLAVDATTGDVWSGVICREEKSAPLQKLQKSMRKQIGLSDKKYRQIRKKGPMCRS